MKVCRCVLLVIVAAVLVQGWQASGQDTPPITKPILFNTPEADKVLAGLQVFPPDNPWNEDVSKLPLLPNSKQMIATIGADRRLAYNLDMSFILVPPDQPK